MKYSTARAIHRADHEARASGRMIEDPIFQALVADPTDTDAQQRASRWRAEVARQSGFLVQRVDNAHAWGALRAASERLKKGP